MEASIYLSTFLITWVVFSIFGRRKRWSWIISLGGGLITAFIALAIALAIFFEPDDRDVAYDDTAAPMSKELSFNTSDKMIESNGNLIVAATKIMPESQESIWKYSEEMPASNITKSPYSSLGKLCKVTGKIYQIQELPPSFGLPGQWSEILMLTRNPNSPLGTSNISFIYKGDVSAINSGSRITCAGYYIGNYEGQNAMGGTIEGLMIVGNVYQKKTRNE